jgi:hypothetical protein
VHVVPAREVLLSDVSGVAQVRVAVPSTVTLNLGASLDLACSLLDGAFGCLPDGARVAMQEGRFHWHVGHEHALPVTLVFVIGARHMLVELTTA